MPSPLLLIGAGRMGGRPAARLDRKRPVVHRCRRAAADARLARAGPQTRPDARHIGGGAGRREIRRLRRRHEAADIEGAGGVSGTGGAGRHADGVDRRRYKHRRDAQGLGQGRAHHPRHAEHARRHRSRHQRTLRRPGRHGERPQVGRAPARGAGRNAVGAEGRYDRRGHRRLGFRPPLMSSCWWRRWKMPASPWACRTTRPGGWRGRWSRARAHCSTPTGARRRSCAATSPAPAAPRRPRSTSLMAADGLPQLMKRAVAAANARAKELADGG